MTWNVPGAFGFTGDEPNGPALGPSSSTNVAEDLADYIDHFQRRVLQDALTEVTATYWLGRAEAFERVGTPDCDQVARLCRFHASLVPFPDDAALIATILAESDHG